MCSSDLRSGKRFSDPDSGHPAFPEQQSGGTTVLLYGVWRRVGIFQLNRRACLFARRGNGAFRIRAHSCNISPVKDPFFSTIKKQPPGKTAQKSRIPRRFCYACGIVPQWASLWDKRDRRGEFPNYTVASIWSAALSSQSPSNSSTTPLSQALLSAGSMGSLPNTLTPYCAATSSTWLSPNTG